MKYTYYSRLNTINIASLNYFCNYLVSFKEINNFAQWFAKFMPMCLANDVIWMPNITLYTSCNNINMQICYLNAVLLLYHSLGSVRSSDKRIKNSIG